MANAIDPNRACVHWDDEVNFHKLQRARVLGNFIFVPDMYSHIGDRTTIYHFYSDEPRVTAEVFTCTELVEELGL